MAKEKAKKEIDAATADREARWQDFLAAAEKQNPVKFAEKKAKGVFNTIPDSFL